MKTVYRCNIGTWIIQHSIRHRCYQLQGPLFRPWPNLSHWSSSALWRWQNRPLCSLRLGVRLERTLVIGSVVSISQQRAQYLLLATTATNSLIGLLLSPIIPYNHQPTRVLNTAQLSVPTMTGAQPRYRAQLHSRRSMPCEAQRLTVGQLWKGQERERIFTKRNHGTCMEMWTFTNKSWEHIELFWHCWPAKTWKI